MLYAGYGMNTNKRQMAERCPAAVSLGAATLADHVFEFRTHADVRVEPGQTTDVVLWKITDECLDALDMLEGYPHYYDRKTVEVDHPELGKIEALVYFMNDQVGLSGPYESYYDMLEEGYTEHGIDTQVLRDACDDAVMFEVGTAMI